MTGSEYKTAVYARGKVSNVAKLLGVSRSTLHRRFEMPEVSFEAANALTAIPVSLSEWAGEPPKPNETPAAK